MKLKQWMKVILITCSVVALAACSTGRKPQDSAVDDANSAYSDDAQAAGLGEDSRFNDQAESGRQSLSKRTYYFDFDSNVVHDGDKPAINANAHKIVANSRVKVLLEGYTDPRGSREYNIGLGERRAKAVAEMLTAKGVNPDQIRIVSYGAEKLASIGRSEADYQLDRRVVLVYLR
ncbi:MAG: OmpA/MotB protein [uncultured bacterium]|nr:MAG: OmpA/MotB protein [uncultured bacterium]